jgi:tetratricopeptide (TPR) repeat protein
LGCESLEHHHCHLLDKALDIQPNNFGALSFKGLSLSDLGKHEEAISLFDKVLAVYPNDPDMLRFTEEALSKLGK